MPRVQLNSLTKYFHHYTRKVNVNDLNYMNHLDHASVLNIIHEARVETLKTVGITERNLIPSLTGDKRVNMFIADINVQFQNQEPRMFDELVIESGFTERTRTGFRMNHRIRRLVPIGSNDFPQNIEQTEPLDKPSFHHIKDQPTGTTFQPFALVEVGVVAVDTLTKQPVELPSSFFDRLGFVHTTPTSPTTDQTVNKNHLLDKHNYPLN
ncbi:hypothetical protein DFA_02764 [Cavenderia fasciculata]|uniref:Thioesterase domain-containing protein n=1 Tax=Cavenderia fasciculata TaxID=261658 RepID=F4PI87_CACFS|nr:uncharacterized protein DFA_02764 [Cavenderia fasciculata]EGG24521.1 hypothetical protein DFA_02764 [Cavenderia fasciculata]|eukprot:XP_004362372.1 hypothetical protein DFA_02764 [Cavenderia fasciculata]